MKRVFTASIIREGDWYVAHCLEVAVASQGETAEEALINVREALELHCDHPTLSVGPDLRSMNAKYSPATPRRYVLRETSAIAVTRRRGTG